MLSFSCVRWLIIFAITAIEADEIASPHRETKNYKYVEDISPFNIWNHAFTSNLKHHYNYPSRADNKHRPYTKPRVSISDIFKMITEWKTKPYHEPYNKPYIISKPTIPTTTTKPTTKPTTAASTTTSGPVLPCECGIRNPARKIIGGEETGVNEYPWMVVLCRATPCNEVNRFCGGTLINDQFVLTAAHCLDPEISNHNGNVFVSLGNHDLTTDEEATTIELEAEEHIFHPGYTPSKFINDMALIKLPIKITMSDTIRPVCLPKNDANTYAGDLAIVTGWGTTSFGGNASTILLDVTVAILNNDACSETEAHPVYGTVPDTQICISGMGENACNGDSGGPLIKEIEDNKFEQIGTVSYGDRCEGPSVFSRITKYLDWIKDETEGALYCASK